MKNLFCTRCGSNNIVADRALAGRLVCSKCGCSSIKASSIYIPGGITIFLSRNKKLIVISLFFLVLFFILLD